MKAPETYRLCEKAFSDLPITTRFENAKPVLKVNVDDVLFVFMRFADLELASVSTKVLRFMNMAVIVRSVMIIRVSFKSLFR